MCDSPGHCSWENDVPSDEQGGDDFDDDRIVVPDGDDNPPSNLPGPLSDQAAVGRDAKVWADLCNVGADYTATFDNTIDELPPITVQEIIDAAKSFPCETGLGSDNVSPRALTRLPADTLQEHGRRQST